VLLTRDGRHAVTGLSQTRVGQRAIARFALNNWIEALHLVEQTEMVVRRVTIPIRRGVSTLGGFVDPTYSQMNWWPAGELAWPVIDLRVR
jgi:hypothetical protein